MALGAAAAVAADGAAPRGASLPFGGCAGIGAQQPVFQGGAVKTADDGLHLVAGGRFDKCEALGFLRFVVSDHFNGIGHQIFGG